MRELIARTVSRLLWEADAIRVSREQPFRVASGQLSPLYVDCRRLISSAATIDLVVGCMHWIARDRALGFDVLAGGETAGIPFAAHLASRMCSPLVYVRKQAKGYGTGSAVEGGEVSGRRVLLVEDLLTDGGSKLRFVQGLREAGAEVADCMVVLDRQQGGPERLSAQGIGVHALTQLDVVLRDGHERGKMSDLDLDAVQQHLRAAHQARAGGEQDRTTW